MGGSEVSSHLKPGCRVRALWRGILPQDGTICSVDDEGSLEIAYDSGDHELHVAQSLVSLLNAHGNSSADGANSISSKTSSFIAEPPNLNSFDYYAEASRYAMFSYFEKVPESFNAVAGSVLDPVVDHPEVIHVREKIEETATPPDANGKAVGSSALPESADAAHSGSQKKPEVQAVSSSAAEPVATWRSVLEWIEEDPSLFCQTSQTVSRSGVSIWDLNRPSWKIRLVEVFPGRPDFTLREPREPVVLYPDDSSPSSILIGRLAQPTGYWEKTVPEPTLRNTISRRHALVEYLQEGLEEARNCGDSAVVARVTCLSGNGLVAERRFLSKGEAVEIGTGSLLAFVHDVHEPPFLFLRVEAHPQSGHI